MIELTVWCDTCDNNVCCFPLEPSDLDVALTRRNLADLNWSCGERGDFCPDHASVAS